MLVTVIYAGLGGLRSVLATDFFLFTFAMFGAVMAAIVAVGLPEVNGLGNLFSHPNVAGRLNLLPDFSDASTLLPVLIIPLAVQWWSVWYPGAEPGGGGYLVQRMLSAKNEKNAMGATLFFNAAHYALRPWPWIIVALASLIIYPDLTMLAEKFPHIDSSIIKHDLAYPAMLTFLPRGIMGIVVASLIAAYMSTMASHLNWGSSYVVNDFYKRFVKQDASEKEMVAIGRISTVSLMILAGAVALLLSNALQAFHILLQIGAGTGLIFILRWFWWRINAYTEITGMIVSFLVAFYLEILHVKLGYTAFPAHVNLIIGVSITTPAWLIVTLLTKPADSKTLKSFYSLVRPGGSGWNKLLAKLESEGNPVEQTATKGDLPLGILCMIGGCLAVYSTVFAAGFYMYGNTVPALVATALAAISILFLVRTWGRLEMK